MKKLVSLIRLAMQNIRHCLKDIRISVLTSSCNYHAILTAFNCPAILPDSNLRLAHQCLRENCNLFRHLLRISISSASAARHYRDRRRDVNCLFTEGLSFSVAAVHPAGGIRWAIFLRKASVLSG